MAISVRLCSFDWNSKVTETSNCVVQPVNQRFQPYLEDWIDRKMKYLYEEGPQRVRNTEGDAMYVTVDKSSFGFSWNFQQDPQIFTSVKTYLVGLTTDQVLGKTEVMDFDSGGDARAFFVHKLYALIDNYIRTGLESNLIAYYTGNPYPPHLPYSQFGEKDMIINWSSLNKSSAVVGNPPLLKCTVTNGIPPISSLPCALTKGYGDFAVDAVSFEPLESRFFHFPEVDGQEDVKCYNGSTITTILNRRRRHRIDKYDTEQMEIQDPFTRQWHAFADCMTCTNPSQFYDEVQAMAQQKRKSKYRKKSRRSK